MSMPSESDTAYGAQYSDGRTAASHAVTVGIADTGLDIAGEDGRVIDRWMWEDVRLAEPPVRTRPVRLANRTRAGARLTIGDHTALPALRAQALYLDREPVSRKRVLRIAGIGAAGVAVILFFVYGLPLIARPIASLIPVAWEEPIGENTITIVNKLFANDRPFCTSGAGVAALAKLTRKLGDAIETPYDIRVDVADSPLVNAFAVPGGRIVLFRGLIEKATKPDEVAGVLAHEMAHVQNRHATLGLINTAGWSALLSAITGGASMSNEAVARLAAHLATSAYTRDLEAEADNGAIAMLTASGIGSEGLLRFFASVHAKESKGAKIPAYLSTHPETNARIAAIRENESPAAMPALSDAEWNALKKICR
jgi:Zn-dependent protease with chaperone function